MRIFRSLGAGAICAVLMTWSMPASSGIIVTVGKLSVTTAEGDTTNMPRGDRFGGGVDTEADLTVPGIPPKPYHGVGDGLGDGSAPIPAGDGYPEEPGYIDSSSYDNEYDPAECEPIGGGLLYCDGQGAAGSGIGTGRGGTLGDVPDDEPMGDEDIVTMGCTAGGGAAAPLLAFVVGLGGMLWTRRRF